MNTLGRYRIESLIGEGAMAEVYRAHDPDIGRAVAIKILKPDFARDADLQARFLREARAAGALSHQHIATIFDAGQADGIAYIAMELVEGQPLDALLAAQGRLPYERVLLLARQLADALDYAHRAGIVHRDVKPSNILVSPDARRVKLVDFGVARVGDADAAQLGRTHAGQLIGTPRYMSPEQALGLPVDQRSDLFSLGVVLYEMMTGKVAFPGTGLATIAIQIAKERVEPVGRLVGDCPPGFGFIIDKLLAKKPDARFSDGAALVAAIDREIGQSNEVEPARRGLPLRLKLPLALAGVTALALGISTLSILDRQRGALEHMALTSGDTIASFVTGNAAVLAADNAGLSPAEQDWMPLQAFVAGAARDPGVRDITVTDADGTVRAATDPALVGRRWRAPAGEAALTDAARATQAADRGRGPGIRFVRPITYAGIEFGKVDLVLKRAALDGAVANARAMMTILAGVVMLAVLGVGYLSGAMVARPLRRLRQALADAAGNGFSLRISHRRRDEIGAVFDAFNRVADTVEPQLAEAKGEAKPDMRATCIVARAA